MAFSIESPFIFMHHFGFSAQQFGSIAFAAGLSFLLGSITGNRLIHRFNSEQSTLLGFSTALLGSLYYFTTFELHSINAVNLLIASCIVFFGLAIAKPNTTANAILPYKRHIGFGLSSQKLIQICIASTIIWIVQALPINNIVTLMYIDLVLIFIAVLLSQCLHNKKQIRIRPSPNQSNHAFIFATKKLRKSRPLR